MTKILFMGRKQVSAKLMEYFSSLPSLEIVGVLTDSHLDGSPTAKLATELNLPLYEFDEALELIKKGILVFDLGISILYWRILRDEFITHPSKGVINFHPAILPEYKGSGGYNLAILEGLSEWGVSAHYIDEGVDTGNIINVSRFPIDAAAETAVTLESKSMSVLEMLAKKIIAEAIEAHSLLPSYKNEGGKYMSRSEMEGMKRIREGDDLSRKVRAFWFPPYDGAYIEIDGNRYTLVDQDILRTLVQPGSTSLFASSKKC